MVNWGWLWLAVVSCGYLWLAVVTSGYLWLHVVTCGYMWLAVVTCGYLWLPAVFDGGDRAVAGQRGTISGAGGHREPCKEELGRVFCVS